MIGCQQAGSHHASHVPSPLCTTPMSQKEPFAFRVAAPQDILKAFDAWPHLGVVGYETGEPWVLADTKVGGIMKEWAQKGATLDAQKLGDPETGIPMHFTGYVHSFPIALRRTALLRLGNLDDRDPCALASAQAFAWQLCSRIWLSGFQVSVLYCAVLSREILFCNSTTSQPQPGTRSLALMLAHSSLCAAVFKCEVWLSIHCSRRGGMFGRLLGDWQGSCVSNRSALSWASLRVQVAKLQGDMPKNTQVNRNLEGIPMNSDCGCYASYFEPYHPHILKEVDRLNALLKPS